ncbi:MAG: hypothetical protein HC822_10775 [Oscillochloris sp.]|nr:hypothetical protein [Oscillochloris sp.]
MYRDDYIMRMITQFGQVLMYVLGLRRRNQFALALITIDNALRDLLGVGSDALVKRSDREILALIRFRDREGVWREEGMYIAGLLYAEAEIYAERDEPQRVAPRALRALQLLVECTVEYPEPLPEFMPPLDPLLKLLQGHAIPGPTRIALFALSERLGRFAIAEDQLFHLLDEHPADAGLRRDGIAFFQRLIARRDDELVAGGLSRDEVITALAELEQHAP